jgi:NAD-dependent dihydropyrimidine dehydrogenase PreA subunit
MSTCKNNQTILFCSCTHGNVIPQAVKQDILTDLSKMKRDVIIVSDLCGMAARRDPELSRIAEMPCLTIVACYPRAIKWLFHAGGTPLTDGRVNILNMRTQSVEEIKSFLEPENGLSGCPTLSTIKTQDDWIPWFPVIDYDRCKNCRQCASFCIFGAYDITDDGHVYVKNPQNCKINCPACARICPEAAIMFPKYEESPINGDRIVDEEAVRGKIKINMDEILGDDVYAALAQRRQKAKRLLSRKQASELAYKEREQCERDR